MSDTHIPEGADPIDYNMTAERLGLTRRNLQPFEKSNENATSSPMENP